jgi:hypothetical protein
LPVAWTLDSKASGFEKMEAGLNARTQIDTQDER